MTRRDAILAEMGLAPVWRLRQRPAAERCIPDAQTSTAESAPSVTAGRHAVSPPPIAQVARDLASRDERIRAMGWGELKATVASCTACKLRAGCTQTVFGVGDESAGWMIVGEAPGGEEDKLGEPFVGQAGRLLDNMLGALGMNRGENVYIANVLKCRPPGNRNPEADEVARCSPYLMRQIELVRPKLIVSMGRFAVQTLLQTDASIASLRGKVHRFHDVPLIVTYHPAYLLRNLPDQSKAWADLVFARQAVSAG